MTAIIIMTMIPCPHCQIVYDSLGRGVGFEPKSCPACKGERVVVVAVDPDLDPDPDPDPDLCPHGIPDGVGCMVCDTDGAAESQGYDYDR